MSNSLRPHGLLCPWGFPGKKTGVGCHFLLQEVFPTQGLNPGLPHCRQTLYHLSHQGSPSLYCILSIRHFELPLPQAHICLNHFSFSQSFFCSLPASSALFITLNYYLLVVKSFFFWSCVMAFGILVPLSGIELRPTQVKALVPNHWPTLGFPWLFPLVVKSNRNFSIFIFFCPQIVLTFLTKNLLEILLVFVLLFSHFLSPLCIPLAFKTFP